MQLGSVTPMPEIIATPGLLAGRFAFWLRSVALPMAEESTA